MNTKYYLEVDFVEEGTGIFQDCSFSMADNGALIVEFEENDELHVNVYAAGTWNSAEAKILPTEV